MTALSALLPAFCRCNCLAFLLAWPSGWVPDLLKLAGVVILGAVAAQMNAAMADAAPGTAGRSAQRR